MARVSGRNMVITWIAAVLCAGVIGALVWFAIPLVPAIATLVGDTLRSTMP